MKISNNPPQHLSNYEVLQHFIQLKQDNDQLQAAAKSHADRQVVKAFKDIKWVAKHKHDERPTIPHVSKATPEQLAAEDAAARRGVSPSLVWVQDEVLKYLCADYNVTARQTADSIRDLTRGLHAYGLTKAELLQACNLAPRSQVGLYLIMEEAETRLAQPYEETMNGIVADVIAPTVLPAVPDDLQPFVNTILATDIVQNIMDDAANFDDEEMAYQEEEYVHEVEWGAGKEAAADDEEDNTME